jgi:DNA ligase-1
VTRLDDLVRTSRDVASTRSRNAKTARLAELLRSLAPDEIAIGVSYLSGVMPQGRIGLGWAAVRDLDAGPPAASATLTLREVHGAFDEIEAMRGAGSAGKRRDRMGALWARATEGERDLLAKLVIGELRQGALVGLMIEAVAEATRLDPAKVRRASMLAGSVTDVATAVLADGEAGLARFALTLFSPVLPMLASPAEDAGEVIEKLGEAVFELKLDGARVQVHKRGDDVRIYSRRLHDVTARLPEIVSAVRALGPRELVLDGEAIATAADGSPLSFQTSMRRFGRSDESPEVREALPLGSSFFDVMFADGAPLVDRPTRERIEILDRVVPERHRMPRIVTADPAEATAFFDRVVAKGHEGLMAKSLEAGYEAGHRGSSWLKLKPAHVLDLVVLAIEQGSGRRSAWLSNIHLGARDPSNGSFVMLGKTFKGMTDEMLAWQTEHFGKIALGREGHVVHVRPETVVEIAFSDVLASPRYPGGMALRFARVRRYRTDKTAAEADTIDTVRRIFEQGHREQEEAGG